MGGRGGDDGGLDGGSGCVCVVGVELALPVPPPPRKRRTPFIECVVRETAREEVGGSGYRLRRYLSSECYKF